MGPLRVFLRSLYLHPIRPQRLRNQLDYGLQPILGDSSTFGLLEWAVFMCAAIINVIIMLNFLVSLLRDAYEKTQMSVR